MSHTESIGREARGLDRPSTGWALGQTCARAAEGSVPRGEPVRDRQRVEDAADREGVHGHLRAGHELLDERQAVPRLDGRGDRAAEVRLVLDDGEPLLALAVDRLDDGRKREPVVRRRGDLPAGLRDAVLGEALALAVLEDGERGGLGRQRVREPRVGGDAGRDRHGPVDPGGDDAVDLFRTRELADGGLVLDGDDRRRSACSNPTAVGSRSHETT